MEQTTVCCDFCQRQQIFSRPVKLNSGYPSVKHTRHEISGKFKKRNRCYSFLASKWYALAKSIALKHFFDLYSPGKEKMQSASWTIRPMTRNRMVTSLKRFTIYPLLPHNCPFLTINYLFDQKLSFFALK